MSVIGPRPALWNQDDLDFSKEMSTVETDSNPSTGWAQY